jgi:hypothetical protein
VPIHLLRYDDYSAMSSAAVERPLLELIADLKYPCTVATVPFVFDGLTFCGHGTVRLLPLPPGKVRALEELIREGVVEVALHGWSHLALSPLREMAEFSDAMPLETQRRLLRDGRSYLEDVFQRKVVTFVPPWNRLGRVTVEALKREGMVNVSSGYPTPYEPVYPLGEETAAPVRNVPCWLSVQETGKALDIAKRWGGEESVVGTLIHDYDVLESGYGVGGLSMTDLKKHLEAWSGDQRVDRRLVSVAAKREGAIGWRRARGNVELLRECWRGFLGRRFWQRCVRLVYWDEEHVRWLRVAGRIVAGNLRRTSDGNV